MLPRSRRYYDMIDDYKKQSKAKKALKIIKEDYDEFAFNNKKIDD